MVWSNQGKPLYTSSGGPALKNTVRKHREKHAENLENVLLFSLQRQMYWSLDKLGRIKICTALKWQEIGRGGYCPEVGWSQGSLLWTLSLLIKEGFYISKLLLCVVKIKWSHRNIIAVKCHVKMTYSECPIACQTALVSRFRYFILNMFLIKAKTVSHIPPWSLASLLIIFHIVHSVISGKFSSSQHKLTVFNNIYTDELI